MRIATDKPKIVLYYLNGDELVGEGDLGANSAAVAAATNPPSNVFCPEALKCNIFCN